MHIDCIKETVRRKVTSTDNVLLEEVKLPVEVYFFVNDTSESPFGLVRDVILLFLGSLGAVTEYAELTEGGTGPWENNI